MSPTRSPSHSFARGATLLVAASLASRLLGGLARIPLTRLLGGEGMGLFQMAFTIYGMAITFAVTGLSVAVSRTVAEWVARREYREAGRVLGVAMLLGLATGGAFWLALDRGAAYIAAGFLGDARAAAALRAIAPAILPVSLISAYKGYFQGYQDMVPTSGAQVLEQVVRVTAMIALVCAFRAGGVERAVAGAAFGNTIGAVASLLFLLAVAAGWGRERGRGRGREREAGSAFRLPPSTGQVAGRLLGVAFPVTIGAAIMPLMDAIQTFLIPHRLQAAGLDPEQATYFYGQLHGMAYPLAGLPAIVASAVAVALVPAITDALEKGLMDQVRGRTFSALRLTLLLSLPATAGLVVLAGPINDMLFGIPEAGVPLVFVSAACVLISLQQSTAGVLQGLGKVSVPVYGLTAGLLVNTVVTYSLTAVPWLGVNGAALGIVAGFLVAAAVNLVAVFRAVKVGWGIWAAVARPLAGSVVMALAVRVAYTAARQSGFGNTPATVAAVALGCVVYGVSLLVMGGLEPAEVEFLPVIGPRLAALITWMRRR